MDDAVAALDVGLDDARIVHAHAMLVVNGDGLAVDGLDHGAILEFKHIPGHDLARNNVVGQDALR